MDVGTEKKGHKRGNRLSDQAVWGNLWGYDDVDYIYYNYHAKANFMYLRALRILK